MDLRQKAVNGLAWSGVQIWGGRAVSFVVFVILSRLLNPEAFGLVAMAFVFIAFIQIILDQGFGDAIVQLERLTAEHLDTAFWMNILSGGALTLVGLVAAGLVAVLFHEPRLIPIIRWLSLSFIFVGLSSTQQAILRRRLAFKELALRSLGAAVSSGIVGVGLALMGYGVWSLVAQSLVSSLIGAMVLWKVSPWRPALRFSKTHFKDLFVFGLNIVGINFLSFLNRHADDLLIGYFLGPTMLGFYTVAYKLLVTMTDLLTSVTDAVAFPVFSRLQNEPERMRRAFYRVTQFTSMISFPAFVGVAVIAPELIVTVFGPKWTLSIPVMQVLAFIGILHSLFYFHNSVVIAVGKPFWRFGISVLNATSNIIAFAVAVRWGIVAVAAAYVIRGYLLSPVEVWMIRRLIQIDLYTYFRQYLAPLAGTLVMAVAVTGLRYVISGSLNLHWLLLCYVLTGGLAYLLTVQWVLPSFLQQLLSLARLVLPRRVFQ
jgi:PST family polysaccharide transporter